VDLCNFGNNILFLKYIADNFCSKEQSKRKNKREKKIKSWINSEITEICSVSDIRAKVVTSKTAYIMVTNDEPYVIMKEQGLQNLKCY
jgi:hypothetical protein